MFLNKKKRRAVFFFRLKLKKMKRSREEAFSSSSESDSDVEISSKRKKREYTQDEIVDEALEGYSMFITGVAGTGKSYLINRLYANLVRDGKKVSNTAYTGIAAVNISGTTLHYFSGVGIESNYKRMKEKVKRNRRAIENWRTCEVLIIDEVSMLGRKFFENLNKIAMKFRESCEFFGGIQLILVGDFFQLPPIKDDFLFDSQTFIDNISNFYELKHNYRQTETEFLDLLHEVRFAKVTEKSKDLLKEHAKKKKRGKKPVLLYSTRKNVDHENQCELDLINFPVREFKAVDMLITEEEDKITLRYESKTGKMYKKMLDRSLFKDVLKLKKGAQVILTKNLSIDTGLYNGSKGEVIGFRKVNGELLPVVKFDSHNNPVTMCQEEISINIRRKSEVIKLSRRQIPLILAWAITIHKCQGLTLDCVEISMDDIFEDGQFYVALSRVRSLNGLFIKNYNASKIKTNDGVIYFYDKYIK